MTVKQLIEELKDCDPDALVYIYDHGRGDEDCSVKGFYKDYIYDDNDNIIGKKIEFWEY